MKKTTIAAMLCMATAFCGFCSGCAANIRSESAAKEHTRVTAEADAAVGADDAAASEDVKYVILNPGMYYSGGGKKSNTIAEGATALTDDQKKNTYFVENGYIATVAAGENLPTPTTASGLTFAGWRYAKDGELVTVDKMPASLTEDMFLYAHWTDGTGTVDPDPKPDPDPIPGGEIVMTGKSTALVFSDATVVITFTMPDWGTDSVLSAPKLYVWSGDTKLNGDWPGTEMSCNTVNANSASKSGVSLIISFTQNSTEKQSVNIDISSLKDGYAYTYSIDDSKWEGDKFGVSVTSAPITRK